MANNWASLASNPNCIAAWVLARISRIQNAIPLAHTTVAACICDSGMLIVVPNLLKMASAIFMRLVPRALLHKQVMDLPTAMAVLGMALMMCWSLPIWSSILEMA